MVFSKIKAVLARGQETSWFVDTGRKPSNMGHGLYAAVAAKRARCVTSGASIWHIAVCRRGMMQRLPKQSPPGTLLRQD